MNIGKLKICSGCLKYLSNQSLSSKMLVLNIVALTATMFIVLALFSTLYFFSARQTLADNVLAEAQLLAANVASILAFHDKEEATKLVASFKRVSGLVRVAVFDHEHNSFVDHSSSSLKPIPFQKSARLRGLLEESSHFEENRLVALVPIFIESERMGTVVMESSLNSIEKDVVWFVTIGTLATILGILASAVVLRRLQLLALSPLIEMSDLAEQVATNKSYHLRANVSGSDEIASLARRLNQMLERIELWDRDMHAEIDQRKKSEQYLDKLARRDELTQIPNRLAFGEDLENSVKGALAGDGAIALMFIDLDDFKQVNDLYGHHSGDIVLQITAKRLARILRDSDILYRIGGDEFAAILNGIDQVEQAVVLSERLIAAVKEKYIIDDQNSSKSVEIGSSIGLAFCPHHATTTIDLLRQADLAMYSAKRSGKNTVRIFDVEIETPMVNN